jgi:hypothetical protein
LASQSEERLSGPRIRQPGSSDGRSSGRWVPRGGALSRGQRNRGEGKELVEGIFRARRSTQVTAERNQLREQRARCRRRRISHDSCGHPEPA